MNYKIVATMFLGVLIPDVQLGRVGWGLCIGWTLWSIFLPLIIEILTETIEMFYIDKTYEIDDTDPNKEQIVTGYLETYRRKVCLYLVYSKSKFHTWELSHKF